MIDRDAFRCVIFECDACDDTLYTEEEEWGSAMNVLRKEGWVSRKVVNDWMHFCPVHKDVR